MIPFKALLGNLKIPPATTSASSTSHPHSQFIENEFDFAESFGPLTSKAPVTPHDPETLCARSHSLVGPSPRFTTHLPSFNCFSLSSDDSDEDEDEACPIGKSMDGEGIGSPNREKNGPVDQRERMGPHDFEILRVLGRGAFGKVFQVREKQSSNVYAMKVMRKDVIIKKNHVEYMKAERDILTKVVHPFIVQLRYSFQTKSKLYLILDFINGGHLFFQLYRQGIFSEDQARVYTAEIVSAVSHLHKNGIVHRDLKPENILMDADGHVMLTDFGLAKEIDESSRSSSMCGTTEYMAPEIILAKGHNKDADWWSVGILLYEMLKGQPPFTHVNRHKLQQRIIKDKVKLPPFLTSEAHSLLKGLLEKEPSKRLGSGANGGEDIKRHRWFKQIDWKRLEEREVVPKFRPDVSGRECTANFDKCWTSMPADDSPAPTPTAEDHFKGYSYVPPNPWLSEQGFS
ncbi:hypothetical protein AMTRI_Chr10g227920 [Amborella trichopoda]